MGVTSLAMMRYWFPISCGTNASGVVPSSGASCWAAPTTPTTVRVPSILRVYVGSTFWSA